MAKCYYICSMLNKRLIYLLTSILLLAVCIFYLYIHINKTKQPNTLFTLLPSAETGVYFSNNLPMNMMSGENIIAFEYYYNGAGVSLGDINNDGLLDIFFTANKSSNKMYLNLGNMKFKDVTKESMLGSKRFSTGSVFADINNDGFLDLYVCNGGKYVDQPKERENQLYVNQQDGTFKELAKEYGINDENYSIQSVFFDYDLDGDLDLYVANNSATFTRGISEKQFTELEKDKERVISYSGRMFENIEGKYEDVTLKSGVSHISNNLGLVASDINNDGWTDLYIANDYAIPDKIFINNKDKTFTNKTKAITNQICFNSMGVDIADINNDGFLDIGTLDMAANDHVRSKTLMESMDVFTFRHLTEVKKYQYQYMFNSLQLNNGNSTFSNIAAVAGVLKTDWSWAPLFADFNNDGYKDYFITNGYRKAITDNDWQAKLALASIENSGKISMEQRVKLYEDMPEIKLPNKLYINSKNLKFSDEGNNQGLQLPSFSSGASYGDLDNDGDLDLVVNNTDQTAFIYRNNISTSNNQFLRIVLKAENKSEHYNAKVYVYFNNELQLQEFNPTRGYQSSVEHCLHFGFTKDVGIVDSVVVHWTDGTVKKIRNVKLSRELVLTKEAKGVFGKLVVAKNQIFETLNASKLNINFNHKENDFDDFIEESLLPHKQSVLGPFSSVADVNNDGLDDVYIGGAKGQSGILYKQQKSGKFIESCSDILKKDKSYEDMGSLFFDYDNDGDKDLYVVSGGGGDVKLEPLLLQDRIYINNGNGDFIKAVNVLPKIEASGQQVRANDIDNDGDLDLFVGGRTSPGKYPYSPKSYILINENGKYIDKSNDWLGEGLSSIGMVTDFVFTDLNNDQLSDLVIVGEWMSVKALLNKGNSFTDVSSEYGFDKLKGWWYSIAQADFNNDGKIDFLLGNIGENIKFKATEENPFHIYTNDFDKSGDQDIVLSYIYKGKKVPSRGRECSSAEMPFITSQCKTYQDFAEASIEDIYGKDQIEKALHFEVNTFSSYILLSDSNQAYTPKKLNIEAQFSPINGFIIKDFDNDGNKDIVLAGNMYHTEVETPRYDAGTGRYLKGLGNGLFNSLSINESGIYLPNDVKDLDFLLLNGKEGVLVSNNNAELQILIKR